jgi:Ni/Co efflux regulator RcnB
MNKTIMRAAAALGVVSCVLTALPAAAQDHRNDDRGHNDQWHNNQGRKDQGAQHRWHNYGGQYGYNGYHGRWRTGQRFTYYNNPRYVISDYRTYNLPPPRSGYRYYRDDNGDVVMAAIGSGIIGLILGSALADHH